MKILVAIISDNNADVLAKSTIRWAGRTGFNTRVFIPDSSQLNTYKEAIEQANHNWYLDIPPSVLVVRTTPKVYAKRHGFDLLVKIPDNMNKWNKWHNHDRNPITFAMELSKARGAFSRNDELKVWRFSNDIVMERII